MRRDSTAPAESSALRRLRFHALQLPLLDPDLHLSVGQEERKGVRVVAMVAQKTSCVLWQDLEELRDVVVRYGSGELERAVAVLVRHLCPAFAEFSRLGPEGMAETFITSNIIPQVHALNAGRWEELEAMIAGSHRAGNGGWAERFGQVFVTDGPVYTHSTGTIPGGDPVPSACFMIVERREGQGWTALAFEMPNAETRDSLPAFLVSIRQVETDTGLDFDGALPVAEQDRLEVDASGSLW